MYRGRWSLFELRTKHLKAHKICIWWEPNILIYLHLQNQSQLKLVRKTLPWGSRARTKYIKQRMHLKCNRNSNTYQWYLPIHSSCCNSSQEIWDVEDHLGMQEYCYLICFHSTQELLNWTAMQICDSLKFEKLVNIVLINNNIK